MKRHIKNVIKAVAVSAIVASALSVSALAESATFWFEFYVSGTGDYEYAAGRKNTTKTNCSVMVDGGYSPEHPIYLATSSTNKGEGVLNSDSITVSSNATKKYTMNYKSANAPQEGDPIYLKGWTSYYTTGLEGNWQP